MYLIEYLVARTSPERMGLFSELALGSTPEEAKDQADMHLPSIRAKYGAQCYRILDSDKRCVAIGPEGFIDS